MDSGVFISYDDETRTAELEVIGSTAAWRAIRRACYDSVGEIDVTGPLSLRLPWWVFLGCRDEIEYYAEKHHLSLSPNESAKARLDESLSALAQYQAAKHQTGPSAGEIREKLKSLSFERDLTDEQARNIGRMVVLPAAATFSVPGAGKTTEALAFFRLKRSRNTRLLVVCPKNAFAAWEEQLEACLPSDPKFVRLRGGRASVQDLLAKDPSKAMVTYEQLPNVVDLIGEYLSDEESFLFLDESHKIKKGFEGVRGNAILSVAQIPSAKLIMSGTPMPNAIGDLVPQFRFLYPEIQADEQTVEQYIRPIYVRTTKKELNLPERKKLIKRLPLKPAQFELYQLLRSEAARDAKNLSRLDKQALRRAGRSALRLLQVATNPALLLSAMDFEHEELLSEVLSEGDSPKLEYVCYRARELAFENKKSIIWSSSVKNVELVANRLLDIGADYIHGKVDAGSEEEEGTREQKIKRFHDDSSCFVLVANPAACSEGISLHTVCHHALYLDRNYNAAQYLQSEDRIHRIGSQNITYVEILQSPGTVDESVERRLDLKIENMARVLDDDSLNTEPEIIDMDEDGFDANDLRDFFEHLNTKVS